MPGRSSSSDSSTAIRIGTAGLAIRIFPQGGDGPTAVPVLVENGVLHRRGWLLAHRHGARARHVVLRIGHRRVPESRPPGRIRLQGTHRRGRGHHRSAVHLSAAPARRTGCPRHRDGRSCVPSSSWCFSARNGPRRDADSKSHNSTVEPGGIPGQPGATTGPANVLTDTDRSDYGPHRSYRCDVG